MRKRPNQPKDDTPERRSDPRALAALWDKIAETAAQALRPLPRMTVPEWADTYRRLSTKVGAYGGPWRTSRFEIARGPMLAVTEPGVEHITVMCCTQLMKTSVLENTMGYFAHLNPCPMLLCMPKDDAARKFSKERLAPMAAATPELTPILGADRVRGGKDTFNYKDFPGGFLALEGAGSPTNLAMRAIRITMLDEIDKYEETKEGDPVRLAEERTATFRLHGRLMMRTCSPTWTETSRIYKSWLESDQRRPFIACPHCGYEQSPTFFKHVHWEKDAVGNHHTATACLRCENCGEAWTEAQRLAQISTEGGIKWRQTAPFDCCGERQEPLTERRWKWDKVNCFPRK
jgi:phage terminase large subunit GpA-like protein